VLVTGIVRNLPLTSTLVI